MCFPNRHHKHTPGSEVTQQQFRKLSWNMANKEGTSSFVETDYKEPFHNLKATENKCF